MKYPYGYEELTIGIGKAAALCAVILYWELPA